MRRIDKIVYNLFILSGVFFISILGFSQSKRSKKTFRGKFLNSPHTLIVPDSTTWSELFSMVSNEYPNNAQQLTFGGSVVQFIYANTTNPLNLAIEGTLIIEATDTFALVAGINFYNNSGAHIINHGKFYAINNNFSSCGNYLWRGITNHNWIGLRGNLIEDAHKALEIKDQTQNTVQQNRFIDNLYGVYSSLNTPSSATFINDKNYLSNPNTLLPLNATENYPRAIAGYYFRDFGLVSINDSLLNEGTKFEVLNVGIMAYNTNVDVKNAFFKDIRAYYPINNFDNGEYNGCAIFYRSNGMNNFSILPYKNILYNRTFENCRIGIRMIHPSEARIKYIGFKTNYDAIVGSNFANSTVIIDKNSIEAYRFGVNLTNLSGITYMPVNNNRINILPTNFFTTPPVKSAITLSSGNNSSFANGNIKVEKNDITVNGGTSGIHISGLRNVKVKENTIERNVSVPISNSGNWCAIECNGNEQTQITCNTVNPGFSYNNSFRGTDFFISNSPRTNLSCNTSNGRTVRGIVFTGANCMDSKIEGNEIGNHNIGLYYSNSAMVGRQPQNSQPHTPGNKWNGTYNNNYANGALNNVGAVNENIFFPNTTVINEFVIEYNRHRANHTMGTLPLYPNNYPDNTFTTNPIKWFASSTLPVSTYCTVTDCQEVENTPTGNGNPSGFTLQQAVATGLIHTTAYNEESRWMMEKDLLALLMKDDSLLNVDQAFVDFYYQNNLISTKQFLALEDTLRKAASEEEMAMMIKTINDSLLHQILQNLHPLQEQACDSIQYETAKAQIEVLINNYKQISQMNNLLITQLQNTRNRLLLRAIEHNNNITPRNDNEVLEKSINHLYFKVSIAGIDTLTLAEINELQSIVPICPQAGGNAVYRARAIYAMINDSMVYNDSVVCRNVGYFRQAMDEVKAQQQTIPAKLEHTKQLWNIYPNPASTEINIVFGKPANGSIRIYNAIGKTVFEESRMVNLMNINIALKNFANGIYFIEYREKDMILVNKFVKH